jgi:hypothetical protein
MPLEFGKLITEQAPLFDGGKLIWAAVFIVFSLFFSVMTWRAQKTLRLEGQGGRALTYWVMNAILLCLGIYFITKAFPRLPSGLILIALFVLLFAVAGTTVVTKSKKDKEGDGGDKKK